MKIRDVLLRTLSEKIRAIRAYKKKKTFTKQTLKTN